MAARRPQVQSCIYFLIHAMNGYLTIPAQELLWQMDQWKGKTISSKILREPPFKTRGGRPSYLYYLFLIQIVDNRSFKNQCSNEAHIQGRINKVYFSMKKSKAITMWTNSLNISIIIFQISLNGYKHQRNQEDYVTLQIHVLN